MNLRTLLFGRVSIVWLLLVGATVASWELGHGIGLHDPRQAGVAILVVAFVKVRLVMLEFMELRGAPLPVRLAAEIWVALVCSVLVLLYLHPAW